MNKVKHQHKTSSKSSDKPKSVLIIGDSIIKHIDLRKLSKKTVYKLSFPGKRVEEIHDEIDKIQTNDELSYVIIHVRIIYHPKA